MTGVLVVSLVPKADAVTSRSGQLFVAAFGFFASITWCVVQARTLHHIVRYEKAIAAIESRFLVPFDEALFPQCRECQGAGIRARVWIGYWVFTIVLFWFAVFVHGLAR